MGNYTMANHSVVTLHCFDGSFEPSYIDASLYCQPDPIWSDWEEGMCNEGCNEAAATCGSGVQDSLIVADSQLSASSFWDSVNTPTAHHHRHGRLFGTGGVAAWVARTTAANEWIQVDS